MNTKSSTQNLIPVQSQDLDGEEQPTVNARDLHAFLGVGKRFATWITDRIRQIGFIEGQDFVCIESLSVPNSGSSKSRPQRTIDYHITLDMAKHLAMLERTPKGHEARCYFIAAEKEYRRLLREVATSLRPQSKVLSLQDSVFHGLPNEVVLADFKLLLEINRMSPGMDENQAFLGAIGQMEVRGIDLKPLLAPRALALESPNRCAELRPTDIARRFGIIRKDGKEDPAAVNRLLADRGFQSRTPKETLAWTPTQKGWPFAVVKDLPGVAIRSGRPVRQLFWEEGLLELVATDLERLGKTRVQTHMGPQLLLTMQ